MEHEQNIIELTGEDGDSIKCEYLDTVLVDNNEYVILLPIDDEAHECDSCNCEDDDCTYEVVIMKIEKKDDSEFLIPVEDDDELERAFEAFQDLMDDEDEDEDL